MGRKGADTKGGALRGQPRMRTFYYQYCDRTDNDVTCAACLAIMIDGRCRHCDKQPTHQSQEDSNMRTNKTIKVNRSADKGNNGSKVVDVKVSKPEPVGARHERVISWIVEFLGDKKNTVEALEKRMEKEGYSSTTIKIQISRAKKYGLIKEEKEHNGKDKKDKGDEAPAPAPKQVSVKKAKLKPSVVLKALKNAKVAA